MVLCEIHFSPIFGPVHTTRHSHPGSRYAPLRHMPCLRHESLLYLHLLIFLLGLGSVHVEVGAVSRRLDHSNPHDKVTEPLAPVALERVALNEGLENAKDLILLDAATVQLVQSVTMVATTKVHIVCSVGLANEGDLGEPWPSAAVWATSHTHDDAVLSQTGFLHDSLELGDQLWQVTL